jgi:hypothetical protein
MALVKYNNNSLSSVTSAAGFPAGAMTLIKTLTASSSSTLSFVDGSSDVVLDSTYPIYLFKFINIHPATDGTAFSFQGNAAGGSGYNETITSTVFQAQHNESGGTANLTYVTSMDQAQGTSFQQIGLSVGNDNDQSFVGSLFLFNPSSTTFVKHFLATTQEYYSSDYSKRYFVGGYFNTTSAIDEIQFKFASGNMDSGTIKLYGIRDS